MFQKDRHKIFVADKFCPSKAEARVDERIDFFEFFCQNTVKDLYFFFFNIILFSVNVTNQIGKKLKERSLMRILSWSWTLKLAEYLKNALDCLFEVTATTMWSDGFIRDYDKLGIGFQKTAVKGRTKLRDRALHPPDNIGKAVGKEDFDLIFGNVEKLLQIP